MGKATYECTFMGMAAYDQAMAVIHAAQGAELALKGRIADEHPMLIFHTLPKSATTTRAPYYR